MITLELTSDDIQIVINALDVAVRSQGMNAAVILIPIAQKLQQAAQARPPKDS